jgi:D-alanyl-D-alanine carboxypeptidase
MRTVRVRLAVRQRPPVRSCSAVRRHLRLAASVVCVGVLAACQTGAAPLAVAPPTVRPVAPIAPSQPAPLATETPRAVEASIGSDAPRAGSQAAVAATRVPPTLQPTQPAATAVPPTPQPTQPAATATVSAPAATPTPDAVHAAQQKFCDAAAPPARMPLPLIGPFIRIDQPAAATLPTPSVPGPSQQSAEPAPHVTAAHVAVLDEASGNLLYAQDAFARVAPASITKIVTTIVALERGSDITTVFPTTVSASALVACDGSSVMGLEPDDHVKLETLLYGMMLPSGNDAAEQVAVSLAGSRDRYVSWMNEKVAALHLRDTHFVTPSGMDADEHYSSAYDMALLARYAMQNPEFRALAATRTMVDDDYYMHNLNPLLGTYAGADGVKIGYTEIAGRTFVASATRDGHRVYVSLMGSRNLSGDAVALLDWVWKTFRW